MTGGCTRGQGQYGELTTRLSPGHQQGSPVGKLHVHTGDGLGDNPVARADYHLADTAAPFRMHGRENENEPQFDLPYGRLLTGEFEDQVFVRDPFLSDLHWAQSLDLPRSDFLRVEKTRHGALP